jgi:hypothetical protein
MIIKGTNNRKINIENSFRLIFSIAFFSLIFERTSQNKWVKIDFKIIYSPFCVPAKVTKLIGLKRPPFLSPTNLIIFACTQNGE